MARHKRGRPRRDDQEERGGEPRAPRIELHPDTKRHVAAIACFGLAAVFLLAAVGQAGPWGGAFFRFFEKLFGLGYYLLPLTALILGVAFFSPEPRRFWGATLIGAFLFILATLGFIDIVAAGKGGLVGSGIGALKQLFGIPASLVITSTILVASFLVAVNKPLSLGRLRKLRGMDEELGGKLEIKLPPEPEGEVKRLSKEKREEGKERAMEVIAEFTAAPAQKARAHPIRNYVAPPLSLLISSVEKPTIGDLQANANIIKRTLESFGIPVEMGEVNVGPTVTRFTLKPAEGVKLSRITALGSDLALALAAHPIRIEAPIPGKSLVGIEVPNKAAAVVRLGSLFLYPEFQKGEPLTFALGRNVQGEPIFPNIDRMPHLLFAGSTGSGKTCGADTYIFSEKGVSTFNELCPLSLNSEKEFSIKIATRDGVETTSKTYNNGICDFYKITTEEGYSIEITAEHPLWVLDKNGEMKWRAGANIKVGDYVAIARGANLFGTEEKIDFKPSEDKTHKSRLVQIPQLITPELGLFLGLLTADGGLTIKNRIVYTQADERLLSLYLSLLRKLFAINRATVHKSGQSNKAKDVTVHSRILKEFLNYLGLGSAGARTKEIPKSIRTAPPEVVKAFLQGLIRNDGHISENTLEITLASEKLIRQTQLMLLNFGVISSKKIKRVSTYPHKTYWRLSVYGKELVKYAEVIGFLTQKEQNKIKELLSLERNPNKDVIPHINQILKNLGSIYLNTFAKLTNRGWQYQNNALIPKYAFSNLRSYNSGDRCPTYAALHKIMTFYQPIATLKEYKKIEKIEKTNFYWARVHEIARTSGEGYDFEVPGSNSFTGNGFINHNSIAIHALIISLLYKNSPEMLRLILVDPKRVELSVYDGIPHLIAPVVTENKRALGALRWLIHEMDRRYELLLKAGARDIRGYNKNAAEPIPYIVTVVDELADLMTTFGREVEGYVIRLAQMSRATGIHLVVSTQRPSVDIITGLIKANITTRIALQVASQVDSRTILDTAGAEKLLGRGDLLYISAEKSKPTRLQGSYVSEEEVKRVVDFICEHNEAPEEMVEIAAANGEVLPEGVPFSPFEALAGGEGSDEDPLLPEAVALVRSAKKASASLLQRRLKVGYARAARLLDIMEERGIIGPGEGAKPRDVYFDENESR